MSVQPFVQTPGNKRRIAVGFSDISNLDENGKLLTHTDNRRLINLANQFWHTDSTFKRTPAKMSMLTAQSVSPTGGETEFAEAAAERADAAVEGDEFAVVVLREFVEGTKGGAVGFVGIEGCVR